MRDLISIQDPESLTACILLDNKNEPSYCVYHPDDGKEQLIFTKNISDLRLLEDFTESTLEQIIIHLNTYGFCIENSEEFCDVEHYEKLPPDFNVNLVQAELRTTTTIKFTI